MTIVECFEKSPIENMIGTLAAEPEKMILVGSEPEMRKSVSVYQRFLLKKGYKTKIILRNIRKDSLKNVVEVISKIVEEEPECVIDVTGGEDLLLMGVGIVYERLHSRKPFQIRQLNFVSGKITDCDSGGETTFLESFSLSVGEVISLYGGVIAPQTPQPTQQDSIKNVNQVWELVREAPEKWNSSIRLLNELEARSDQEDSLRISVPVPHLPADLSAEGRNCKKLFAFLERLCAAHLIRNLRYDENEISYQYKNNLTKRCFRKAGDVLELKTYFEARRLKTDAGPYYSDCYLSVTIDWDGITEHDSAVEMDTKNEIDVMLMRNLIPVFISCKNGRIEEEELYKLNTVAERFGGKYAKKVLIASDFHRESPAATRVFLQRAKDMNIRIIPNAAGLREKQWETLMKSLA